MEDKKFDNWQFKRLREFLGYNQSEFAEKVGSAQQIINMIEKNNRGVPASIREGFYKTFKISYEEAIACESVEALNVALNKQTINNSKVYSLNTNNIVSVPFYSAKAAAGLGEALPDYPEKDVIFFDARWLKNILGIRPENASIIQATGDSMDGGDNPIKNGDLLLIDSSVKDIINEKVFVIQLNNSELVVKKVVREWDGTVKLISNNPIYEDRIIKESENAQIIGRVVWNGSKENV